MRISDWSSDVCSSDLVAPGPGEDVAGPERRKEASSEGDQELVAGDRTHAFVDPAEAGHVDDEDGVARLPETRRLQYRLDLLVEAEAIGQAGQAVAQRSEEHTSELQSLKRNSYAVFCLKKKK